jgi:hypothetical protein
MCVVRTGSHGAGNRNQDGLWRGPRPRKRECTIREAVPCAAHAAHTAEALFATRHGEFAVGVVEAGNGPFERRVYRDCVERPACRTVVRGTWNRHKRENVQAL